MKINFPEEFEHLQDLVDRLKNEIPSAMTGFDQLHRHAVGSGVLNSKFKQLIALAVAICVHCDGCITYHVRDAMRAGATRKEIADAIGVAILMGGGPAVVYGAQALEAVRQFEEQRKNG